MLVLFGAREAGCFRQVVPLHTETVTIMGEVALYLVMLCPDKLAVHGVVSHKTGDNDAYGNED